jgi:hypothetical protein
MSLKHTPLATFVYGSHLYGTNSATSDYDYKTMYLPCIDDLLLGHKMKTYKVRHDANHQPIPDDAPMPAGGTEIENIPVHNFVDHWLSGQAYAVELVFSRNFSQNYTDHGSQEFKALLDFMLKNPHRNVYGMLGFAQKQVIDYVRRGERKVAAEKLVQAIKRWRAISPEKLRLDTVVNDERIIVHLAAELDLETGFTQNNNRTFLTLKLNGREYLETTTLEHLENAVQKLIDVYGERSAKAAEEQVDWKSLMHSKRVFEQVKEYLRTGTMTFPRPNVEELLKIKQGLRPLEDVKAELLALDNEVLALCEASTLPDPRTLREKANEMLLSFFI